MRSRYPVYALPQGAFSVQTMATITTFPGINLIPEWKLG